MFDEGSEKATTRLRQRPPLGTMLLAEDEACVREPVAQLLERAGFGILAARDALETVEVFSRYAQEIVAVLLDYNMPGGASEEVLEQLQRIRPDVPVIVMSGYLVDDLVARFPGAAVVGFLQKPFSSRTLIGMVTRATASQ